MVVKTWEDYLSLPGWAGRRRAGGQLLPCMQFLLPGGQKKAWKEGQTDLVEPPPDMPVLALLCLYACLLYGEWLRRQ